MDKLKNYYQLLIPILLGIVSFIFVTGGGILWPTNINWLFLHGDMTDGLFAWQYFRHTPIFQNPLGANFPYGMGTGGAIIYAEPLFLFSFPFKLLSKILPTPFQYMGLWILLCFILQAIFSWKLIAKFAQGISFNIFGSIFFILAPPFLWRLHGHPQFLGQWLILAAILLNLSNRFYSVAWPLILILSSLVHPYLLLILLALWAADLIQRKIGKELNILEILKKFFLTGILLLLVMWQAGYFMIQSGLEAGGLGFYRMNMLSFVDPSDDNFNSWSYIMPKQPHTEGDFEGFSFLGFGMILLFLLAIFRFLAIGQFRIIFCNLKKIIPLIGISFFLLVFALSNQIAWGKYELFQYKLPAFANVFRATGRMVLPMYYLIYLGILYLIIKTYNKATAKLLISACLVIQIIDSSNIYVQFRNWFSDASPYSSPLKSSVWLEAAKKYTNLNYVLPEVRPPDWVPLINYSAFNNLNINIGYFARTNVNLLNQNRTKLVDWLSQGKLRADTFYVIKDMGLKRILAHTKMSIPASLTEADGFLLLLPNWKNIKDIKSLNNKYKLYELGTTIFFSSNIYLVLINGWSLPESNGIWSNADSSTLVLKLPITNSNLHLTIDAIPFINKKHPFLETTVLVNSKYLGKLVFDIKKSLKPIQLEIPHEFIGADNLLKIKFVFKNAISPKKLDLSLDNRKLGLFFSSLVLTKIN